MKLRHKLKKLLAGLFMNKYHTSSLDRADIFTVMGSIYAEVSRYDTAIRSGNFEQADQASKRANELIEYTQELSQLNLSQKLEIKAFSEVYKKKVKACKTSQLDSYLMPFALASRLRQAV